MPCGRVRSLSIATYIPTGSDSSMKVCGYGLHVDSASGSPSIFLFEDRVPAAASCTTTDYKYGGASSNDLKLGSSLDSYSIDKTRLKFVADPVATLTDVVFVPPNPTVYINGDTTGNTVTQAGWYLRIFRWVERDIRKCK